MKVFLRTEHNYDMDAASQETALVCRDKSRAKQEFKEESDINTLVKRFGITGELPNNVRMPLNADFQALVNFQDAMNAIVMAQESFAQMPAEVRSRFANDPARFVAFCSDERNRDEAVKLGLVVPPVQPVVAPATPVGAPATPPSPPST